jgi:hypothetical protein
LTKKAHIKVIMKLNPRIETKRDKFKQTVHLPGIVVVLTSRLVSKFRANNEAIKRPFQN